jgi:hypothetical protein
VLYADRCADLAQLLRFVDGEVHNAKPDPAWLDYTVASSFGSRVGDSFESRAAGIASDLAFDDTPDRIRAFRGRLLSLRKRPDLVETLASRLISVYGRVIPSLAPQTPRTAMLFSVGPEAQITGYEKALLPDGSARVLRLYPRDFWLDEEQ